MMPLDPDPVTDDPPQFSAGRSGRLGRARLGEGKVMVRIQGDALVLLGAKGGRLDLPFLSISRVRISRMPNPSVTRRRYYRLSLWTVGDDASMTLRPDWQDKEAFHAVLRALAAGVVAARGEDALESGVSWGAAARSSLWLFIALAVVGLGANWDLHWHLSLPAIIAALAGLAVAAALTTRFDEERPRRLDNPAGLEKILSY